MANNSTSKRLAILALFINGLLLPGLGTIITHRKIGLIQLSTVIAGALVAYIGATVLQTNISVGLIMMMFGSVAILCGWAWSVATAAIQLSRFKLRN